MSRIVVSVAVLGLALSACASVPMPSNPGPLPPSAMTCNAAPASWAVGQVASAGVVERVRLDSHSRSVRVLRPGQMVTMEFNAERVDIRVDGGNVILAVTCG